MRCWGVEDTMTVLKSSNPVLWRYWNRLTRCYGVFFPGAFLIPYFICLAIAGIPIFFVELGIGQRLRRGSVACWNEISPYLGGIGIACLFVSFLVSVYYNMIIGWSFYYMFISMQEHLPYQSCDTFDHITQGKNIGQVYAWYFPDGSYRPYIIFMDIDKTDRHFPLSQSISQRSAECRRFSPVSSHRESWQGVLGITRS
jgi:hypothetical protein